MNYKGLTIFEVMLAILIVGITVTSLLSLQGALSRAVFTSHAFIDRLGFIKSFFVEADRDRLFEKDKAAKKVVDNPPLTMSYSTAKATSKGLSRFQMIEVETVTADYPTVFGSRTEKFALLRFLPRTEKKK